MSSLLLHFEKIIWVDGWVPKGLQRIEEIPFIFAIAKSVQTRGRTLPLLSNFTSSGQYGLSKKGRWVSRPVYFISRAFQGAEERYPQMDKLAFVLVTATRKLKPYFQAHTIIVLTNQPLRRAMSSPEVAGRMALWAIELNEFDIQYRPRTMIKGQAMADFIAEFA